jgi:two-component system, cell cycle response regulator DivK
MPSPRPLILVVDDSVDNREMYTEYLELSGFATVEAVDGASAVATARSVHPAVVLMDLSLPGMDGWEATQILKADPLTKDILVFALTGHAEAASRDHAQQAGCDLFIAKPCSPQDLVEHVMRELGIPELRSR